jgi:hypothetical protein
VTEAAGEVLRLAAHASETGTVWAATRAANAVTADAELLACAAVTSGARGRVDARLHSVVSAACAGGDPPGGVRAARRRARAHLFTIVAALAGALGVARRAEARICPRLHRVARDEASAVKTGQGHFVERERRGQRRDRADPMTRGARPLGVAARAQVPRARRAHAMLTNPVAVMHQVARGRPLFGCKVLVAAVAVAKRPLVLVLVAAEAGSHLRQKRLRVLLGCRLVAADTVAVRRNLMRTVREAKLLARQSSTFTRVGRSVATEARVRVVWFGMTATARGVRGEVNGRGLTCGGHAFVAVDTVDAVGSVYAMLERVRRIARAEAKNACARGEAHESE